jgi:hypothetical protein
VRDYEHAALLPHPDALPHGQRPEPASVQGTMAGRAFTTASCQVARRDDGWHVWVRRLVRASLDHAESDLHDDATMLYLRWDGPQA